MKTYVFTAAKGNATAINLASNLRRSEYAKINQLLQKSYPVIEQVGFYEIEKGLPRLQMAGGEFCGNATRSFACLLKDLDPTRSEFSFYVSGFLGLVNAKVKKDNDDKYFCEAFFNDFSYAITKKSIDGSDATIVNLGGIIHIVIKEDDIPFIEGEYTREMKRIKDGLNVDGDAVGVLWIKRKKNGINMKPVVWVKAVNTCYYETSCGSGSIAIGLMERKNTSVIQPSGGEIKVKKEDNKLILSSEIEKILEFKSD